MAIDYDQLMSLTTSDEFEYTDTEAMLYALGVGFGRDPLNKKELPFVYEKGLTAVPTFATVIAINNADVETKAGIHMPLVVQGEQLLSLHKPLPPSGRIIVDTRVLGAWDKGQDKGAVYAVETSFSERATGDIICSHTRISMARGDGGFGGPREGAPVPHKLPEREPDLIVRVPTKIDQAALYRLSGDRTPIHIEMEAAKRSGFPAPILHGQCSYGSCCRAILSTLCDYDPSLIRGFNARFSSIVFPGETLDVEIWKDGNMISFRAWVKARNVIVLNNGQCTLDPDAGLSRARIPQSGLPIELL